LLNLSRLTRGEMSIAANVNLSRIASDIAQELRQEDPNRHVEFIIEDNILVSGDKRLLYIALQNLLANAWKYTSHHSAAHIEFGRRSGPATIYYVRDDGAGFDMQYVNKLFCAFQRLHNRHEFPGSGIGLATVARVIHRHGGQVWAEGSVEKGATFYFTLSP